MTVEQPSITDLERRCNELVGRFFFIGLPIKSMSFQNVDDAKS